MANRGLKSYTKQIKYNIGGIEASVNPYINDANLIYTLPIFETPWQREFEDDFPYEETPDQLTAIQEIKADMEKPKIMDRLLCGDVGYGKTEVALRAIFKCVMSGKQAAMLAPTTILAQQHCGACVLLF